MRVVEFIGWWCGAAFLVLSPFLLAGCVGMVRDHLHRRRVRREYGPMGHH